MKQAFTFGRYLRDKFGQKVYKIPVSIPGFTCPNIDGNVAVGGCSFCENESFSPNLSDKTKKNQRLNLTSGFNPLLDFQLTSMNAQIELTKRKLAKKFNATRFLVYFQSFSNTYAPLPTLKALYESALSHEDIIGLSIGTRSDCLTEETLVYLAELAQTCELWVEIGVQSMFDETLARINRGEDFENVEQTMRRVKLHGLNLCAHLIFGLPDETPQMMFATFEKVISLGINSIKMHPLYVVSHTALANELHAGTFTPISQEAYVYMVTSCIAMLPPHISIQRVSAGIDDDTLIAPQWCRNKHAQMNTIREALRRIQIDY